MRRGAVVVNEGGGAALEPAWGALGGQGDLKWAERPWRWWKWWVMAVWAGELEPLEVVGVCKVFERCTLR